MTSNAAGALAYLGFFVTGIIFLVTEPYRKDRFVRFHSFQSILFTLAAIGFFLIWALVATLLALVSFGLLAGLLGAILVVFRIAFLLVWLFLMYKAYNNERFELPLIGAVAARQAG